MRFNRLLRLLFGENERRIKSGDFCQWESQGVDQWKEPRRVIHIGNYGKEEYAFFSESPTGIKVSELRKVK